MDPKGRILDEDEMDEMVDGMEPKPGHLKEPDEEDEDDDGSYEDDENAEESEDTDPENEESDEDEPKDGEEMNEETTPEEEEDKPRRGRIVEEPTEKSVNPETNTETPVQDQVVIVDSDKLFDTLVNGLVKSHEPFYELLDAISTSMKAFQKSLSKAVNEQCDMIESVVKSQETITKALDDIKGVELIAKAIQEKTDAAAKGTAAEQNTEPGSVDTADVLEKSVNTGSASSALSPSEASEAVELLMKAQDWQINHPWADMIVSTKDLQALNYGSLTREQITKIRTAYQKVAG